MKDSLRFITNTIHAGESETASATPIFLGATTDGRYLRNGNPTLDAFEEKVRVLEGGAAAISTASGMAAVTQTLFTVLRPGDRLVISETVYHYTTDLVERILPEFGVVVETVDMQDLSAVAAALQQPAKAVYFEPLTNPNCIVIDTVAITEMAHAAGALVIVDNTFLSPALLRPISLGVDVVVHSATKFLCGHGDALAGVIVTKTAELGEQIHETRNTFGGILSPLNGYLLLRGIKTLSMRMARHQTNAQAVAQLLADQAAIKSVQYPGLDSAQGHEIAAQQWDGFGAMLNVEFVDQAAFDRFFERIDLIKPWVSLGDPATLVVGGPYFGGTLNARMAVGLEDIDDLTAELMYAVS